MIEEELNRKIHNRLNEINYPDVVTCLIINGEAEFSFNTEYIWYNPTTDLFRFQDAYYYQGTIEGEKICEDFVDLDGLKAIYNKVINPKKKIKEFDNVRLDPSKKRITAKDRQQITKYVYTEKGLDKSTK